jgi:hypothetical protein
MLQYLLNILIGFDQLANAIIGGSPNDTISARLGRNYPNSFFRKFVDFLFGPNHCKDVALNGDGAEPIIK